VISVLKRSIESKERSADCKIRQALPLIISWIAHLAQWLAQG